MTIPKIPISLFYIWKLPLSIAHIPPRYFQKTNSLHPLLRNKNKKTTINSHLNKIKSLYCTDCIQKANLYEHRSNFLGRNPYDLQSMRWQQT